MGFFDHNIAPKTINKKPAISKFIFADSAMDEKKNKRRLSAPIQRKKTPMRFVNSIIFV